MPALTDPAMKDAAALMIGLKYPLRRVAEALHACSTGDTTGLRGVAPFLVDVADHLRGMTPPSFRTIQRWAQEMGQPAESKWELTDAEEEEIPFVLELVKYMIRRSRGNKTFLTKDEAALAISIHWADTTLASPHVWALTESYAAARQRGIATTDLDVLLAFRPWRGVPNLMEYCELIKDGVVGIPEILDAVLGADLLLGQTFPQGFPVLTADSETMKGLVWGTRLVAQLLPEIVKTLDYADADAFEESLLREMLARHSWPAAGTLPELPLPEF